MNVLTAMLMHDATLPIRLSQTTKTCACFEGQRVSLLQAYCNFSQNSFIVLPEELSFKGIFVFLLNHQCSFKQLLESPGEILRIQSIVRLLVQ